MVQEHEMTKELGKNDILTSEQIFRNEHAASSGSRKVINGPMVFATDSGGLTTLAPVAATLVASSQEMLMEPSKAYRLIGTVDFHFRLSKGTSAALVTDIYQPANEALIIKSENKWDRVSVIKATTSADGVVQIMEVT